ncbi:hypothetical protein, partial [Azospirillum sp. TSA6c]|uniref:hypothetical protein n=1 Tax=Azospirillum sp. TSA6c TaxID=709813 RepID=UPI001B3B70F9
VDRSKRQAVDQLLKKIFHILIPPSARRKGRVRRHGHTRHTGLATAAPLSGALCLVQPIHSPNGMPYRPEFRLLV